MALISRPSQKRAACEARSRMTGALLQISIMRRCLNVAMTGFASAILGLAAALCARVFSVGGHAVLIGRSVMLHPR